MRKLLFIFALFFFVDAAHSQVVEGVEIVKPRIVAGDWDSVTKKFPVAVEFTIAKGWHMYWLNPGDAGSPPEVKWALPMDWQIGKLQFPVPVHEIEDGFESYAYYDKLVLYAAITSPLRPKPNDLIETSIKWMVCKDICVAGKQLIKQPYEMMNERYDWPKLPLIPTLEEAGLIARPFGFSRSISNGRNTSFLEFFEGADTLKITDFFPLPYSDRPMHVHAENGLLARTWYSAKTDAEEIRAREDQSFDRVNGLVFIGDKVYWLKAP